MYLRGTGDDAPATTTDKPLTTSDKIAIGHATFWGLMFAGAIVWKLWDDRQYRKGKGIYSYRRK